MGVMWREKDLHYFLHLKEHEPEEISVAEEGPEQISSCPETDTLTQEK